MVYDKMTINIVLIIFILITICSPRSIYETLVQENRIGKPVNFFSRSIDKARLGIFRMDECNSNEDCGFQRDDRLSIKN